MPPALSGKLVQSALRILTHPPLGKLAQPALRILTHPALRKLVQSLLGELAHILLRQLGHARLGRGYGVDSQTRLTRRPSRRRLRLLG